MRSGVRKALCESAPVEQALPPGLGRGWFAGDRFLQALRDAIGWRRLLGIQPDHLFHRVELVSGLALLLDLQLGGLFGLVLLLA